MPVCEAKVWRRALATERRETEASHARSEEQHAKQRARQSGPNLPSFSEETRTDPTLPHFHPLLFFSPFPFVCVFRLMCCGSIQRHVNWLNRRSVGASCTVEQQESIRTLVIVLKYKNCRRQLGVDAFWPCVGKPTLLSPATKIKVRVQRWVRRGLGIRRSTYKC